MAAATPGLTVGGWGGGCSAAGSLTPLRGSLHGVCFLRPSGEGFVHSATIWEPATTGCTVSGTMQGTRPLSPSPRGLRDQMLSAYAPPIPKHRRPRWRALRPLVPADQSGSSGWAGSLPQTSRLSSASLRRKFLCSAILACLNQCRGQTGCGLGDSHGALSRGWFLFSVVLRGNTHHCHHRYHQAQGASGPWRRAPGCMGGLNSARPLTPPLTAGKGVGEEVG